LNIHGVLFPSTLSPSQTVTLNDAIGLTGPLVIHNVTDFTLNGTYTAQSAAVDALNSITIASGATLSTRQTAGGDPATAHSTGNSGDVSLTAPQIQVGDTARILAQADSGFQPGNLTLTAATGFDLTWTDALTAPVFKSRTAQVNIT